MSSSGLGNCIEAIVSAVVFELSSSKSNCEYTIGWEWRVFVYGGRREGCVGIWFWLETDCRLSGMVEDCCIEWIGVGIDGTSIGACVVDTNSFKSEYNKLLSIVETVSAVVSSDSIGYCKRDAFCMICDCCGWSVSFVLILVVSLGVRK